MSDERLPRLLRLKQVREVLGGVSRDTIERMERAGDFPSRVHITRNCVGWLEHEIADFITKQAEKRRRR